MAEGVDGLLRDKTRPPGTAPLAPSLVDKVVARTLEPPAHEATHWTVRAMAKAVVPIDHFRAKYGNLESDAMTAQLASLAEQFLHEPAAEKKLAVSR